MKPAYIMINMNGKRKALSLRSATAVITISVVIIAVFEEKKERG